MWSMRKWILRLRHHKMVKAVAFGVFVVMLIGATVVPVLAQYNADQAIEMKNDEWSTSKPTYSLTYVGYVKGCQKGSTDSDYKYRINFSSGNVGPSLNPDNLRLYVTSSLAAWSIQQYGNGTLSGYNLTSLSGAYLCIGSKSNALGANQKTVFVFNR